MYIMYHFGADFASYYENVAQCPFLRQVQERYLPYPS